MHFLRSNIKDATDEQLMVAIQSGDSAAFETLYHRYSERLLVYFYKMLGSEESAQDFLQDIFLKLIRCPNAFNAKKTFSTWIFSIAANMCKNEYRFREVRKDTIQNGDMDDITDRNDTETTLSSRLDEASLKIQISSEIQKMDPDQRNTFLLRFQENFSIKEISQILNCSQGTVKSRLFYITRKLANKLKNFDPLNNEVSYHAK